MPYKYPWRKFWKPLENAISSSSGIGPIIPIDETVASWVSGIPFVEIAIVDEWVEMMIADIATTGTIFFPCRGGSDSQRGQSLSLQLVLRYEFALDFCQGRYENNGARRSFNWTVSNDVIGERLLISSWHKHAFHWARKMYPPTSEVMRFVDRIRWLGDPSNN